MGLQSDGKFLKRIKDPTCFIIQIQKPLIQSESERGSKNGNSPGKIDETGKMAGAAYTNAKFRQG